MTAANLLENLGALLLAGGVEVVDCSGTLGPDTPLLKLPPDFAKNRSSRKACLSCATWRGNMG